MKPLQCPITATYSLRVVPSSTSLVNRLRFRHLALIIAIADYRTLHSAADQLGLSQPAVTKMLREVESGFGLPLFERLARGMTPTVFGESVIRYARLLLADLEHLRDELDSLAAGNRGKVLIGAIIAAAPLLLAHVVADIKQREPRLEVSILNDTSDVLLPMLAQGRLDFVIGRTMDDLKRDDLQFEKLWDEALSVVAGVDHPLAKARELNLKDLGERAWILYPQATPMRRLLELVFRDAGMPTPQNVVETSSVITTTTLLD
jgi:DNA-binding transcriptional LysR family regulator